MKPKNAALLIFSILSILIAFRGFAAEPLAFGNVVCQGDSQHHLQGVGTNEKVGLTFFGWSDQHVKTNGDVSHLLDAVDAMNQLPGTAFPESIGGKVASPKFIFGCGDVTEWPTHAAVRGYDKVITERLKFPCYDILGNHDDGGKVPSDTMKNGSPSDTAV